MSEIEKAKKTATEIMKTLEAALRNIRAVYYKLGRENLLGDVYKKYALVSSQEVSEILNKDQREVEHTLDHLRLKKYNFDGESCYSLSDVLTFIKNTIEQTFSAPIEKVLKQEVEEQQITDKEESSPHKPINYLSRVSWAKKPIPGREVYTVGQETIQ